MLTITYRQLVQMDIDYPGRTSEIEVWTGNRAIYGLDKSISILDIIEHVNLDVGTLCLDYVEDDISILSSTITIECLRANLTPWNDVFPGDTRVVDLLNMLEMYIQNIDIPAIPDKDACGKDIPGFYGIVPESQITDALALIKASTDALDLTPVTYTHSYWSVNGAPWTEEMIAEYMIAADGRWSIDTQYMNTIDPDSFLAYTPSYYSEQNINYIMTIDPDHYLKESTSIFDIQNSPGYGIIIRNTITNWNSPNTAQYNNKHLSCQMLVDNLSLAVLGALNTVNVTNSVLTGIIEYMRLYAAEKYFELQAAQARLLDINPTFTKLGATLILTYFKTFTIYGGGGVTGTWAQDTHSSAYISNLEQQILNAGFSIRAEIMRDPVFVINAYDSNANGVLSASERAQLEQYAKILMRYARLEKCSELQMGISGQVDALPLLYDDRYRIIPTITPYLI